MGRTGRRKGTSKWKVIEVAGGRGPNLRKSSLDLVSVDRVVVMSLADRPTGLVPDANVDGVGSGLVLR